MGPADGALPVPTPDTEPYWQAADDGELRIPYCVLCGRYQFYPRSFCRYCYSTDIEWRTVSGRGRLVSYVINHRPLPPAPPGAPQIIALVELDEGPRMMTNIVDTPPEPSLLPLDAAVAVTFRRRGDHMIPVFTLREPA